MPEDYFICSLRRQHIRCRICSNLDAKINLYTLSLYIISGSSAFRTGIWSLCVRIWGLTGNSNAYSWLVGGGVVWSSFNHPANKMVLITESLPPQGACAVLKALLKIRKPYEEENKGTCISSSWISGQKGTEAEPGAVFWWSSRSCTSEAVAPSVELACRSRCPNIPLLPQERGGCRQSKDLKRRKLESCQWPNISLVREEVHFIFTVCEEERKRPRTRQDLAGKRNCRTVVWREACGDRPRVSSGPLGRGANNASPLLL